MASPITTQATTLEGQLAEVLHYISDLEGNPATNPTNTQSVTGKWIVNQDEFSFQGTFLVRTTGTVNESGHLVLIANEHLNDSAA